MVSLADSLWHRNRVLAEAALEHPFVQGIGSGELAPATFAYYVGQDAVFLDAFCRAYALALAKSPDQDGLIAFRELLDAAADELRLHQGYAARWDVDLHQGADRATSAYTNFLLAVAALEPVGHIAAAMTPCMRLYAHLGQQLAAQTKPDSPYRDWVITYSSPQFEAQARRVEGLLDRYGGDQRPPGRPVSPGDGTRTAVLRRCRPMRETMTLRRRDDPAKRRSPPRTKTYRRRWMQP